MDRTNTEQRHEDGTNEKSTSQCVIERPQPNGETLLLKRFKQRSNHRNTLILDARISRAGPSINDLFLKNLHALYNSIPKHITSFDEKYMIRCLESIRNYAFRASVWNFTSEMKNLVVIKGSNNMSRLAIDYPYGEWTITTSLSRSQSMINILKSPLLQNFVSKPFDSEFTYSLQEPNSTLSLQEVKVLSRKYIPEPMHTRNSSISSTNSSCSDQSSSSTHNPSFQGMVTCTWKNGLPHHVFTVDGKEVYVAKLSKVESSGGEKGSDYVYTFFHSSSNGKKECHTCGIESETIAKMLVSTSTNLCPSKNSETRETQFVLSVSNVNQMVETGISNRAHRKNKRLTKKVVDIFKPAHFHKLRPSEDVRNKLLDLAPNLELAAIVVKEIFCTRKKAEIGGWGLNFLKRPSLETSECITRLDVIIPAGFHGGPKTGGGGPSGLTERWASGGKCDCGGWDIGCPLTILDYDSSRKDNSGECKSVDLFVQGSKQNGPAMKLVNFCEDSYYIHFQSPTLSCLQSFAIAAAIIHSRSPVLRPK